MENRIMTALEDAVAELTQAIQDANSRFQNVGELETALAAERETYANLVASEEAEDVQQNQELQDARAATDAALAQVQAATQSIQAAADQVSNLGSVAAQEGSDAPTDAAPAESGSETPTAAATGTPDAPDGAGTDAAAPDEAAPGDVAPTPGDNVDGDAAPTEDVGRGTTPEETAAEASDPTSTVNMRPDV